MPKLYNKQRQREIALELALKRSMLEFGFLHEKDVAQYLNMSRSSFSSRKKDHFQKMSLLQFANMARRLHWSGKDVCAMIGVPYTND